MTKPAEATLGDISLNRLQPISPKVRKFEGS